jgi:methyltransferase family protein
MVTALEDRAVVSAIKDRFAPDGGANREHNAMPESLGFGLIHYGLVTNLKPERALVIGSRYGYVPSIIALALRANGSGELDFVDANYSDAVDGFETAYGGVGHWQGDPGTGFAEFGLGDVVRVHVKTSAEFFAGCENRYGYVYLDGNHGYEGCRFDFEQAVRLAEDHAPIVLHDTLVTDPRFGVGRLVAELETERFDRIVIPAWPGLAIVQEKRPSARA